jgi:hypothetical protein
LALPALGGNTTVQGNIVIVNDSAGTALDPSKGPFLGQSVCTFAGQGLYTQKDDDYDAIAVFTTTTPTLTSFLTDTPQGNPVRETDMGVAFGSWLIPQPPSAYGSPATLKHCAYMGPIAQFPTNPDDIFQVQAGPLGGENPTGVSGIGVLGHEFGHHWLVYAAYDLGDGMGPSGLFRGDTRQDLNSPSYTTGNLHWSAYADTHSVMYGNKVTDQGGDMFLLSSEEHKYGPFDQYLMGMRDKSEVPPMLVIDDGSQRGYADFPLSGSATTTVMGTGVTVTVDDIIRAIGPRAPDWQHAQHCFRFAFIIVTQKGQTATAAQIATVEAYRQRWETWFAWATDGRGSVDTRLDAIDACPATPLDAGQPMVDAGMMETPDAGGDDAGIMEMKPPDMMHPPPDAGSDDTAKLRPGCGCNTGSPLGVIALGLLLAMRLLRRARED